MLAFALAMCPLLNYGSLSLSSEGDIILFLLGGYKIIGPLVTSEYTIHYAPPEMLGASKRHDRSCNSKGAYKHKCLIIQKRTQLNALGLSEMFEKAMLEDK